MFFFKQKTAYEMRISDWSSDVCSSDLAIARRSANRAASGIRGGQGKHPMKIMSGNSNLPLAQAIAAYLEIPLTQASVRRYADEIGRASCRERVCQYV